MKKIYISALALLMAGQVHGASDEIILGDVLTMGMFGVTDIYNMSQKSPLHGSARTIAMGGAFTSLGADLSATSINPAGLGLYQSSEFGISLGNISAKSTINNSSPSKYKQQFDLNNLGVALNLYNGTGALTSFTFGFSYNKIANMSDHSSYSLNRTDHSITDVFARFLNEGFAQNPTAYHPDALSYKQGTRPFHNSNIWTGDFGAVLAFQTDAVWHNNDPLVDRYEPLYGGQGANYFADPSVKSNSYGQIGEFDISGGLNLGNKVYLGFTVGILDITYGQYMDYSEKYPVEFNKFYMMDYLQEKHYDGTGVNFKLGAIVSPVKNLRIGLTYQTPTYVQITQSYFGEMYSFLRDEKTAFDATTGETILADYNFNTPMRLGAGVSYIFGNKLLLAVDYERVSYNKMKLHDSNSKIVDSYKKDAENLFQGANNLRFGAECWVMPAVALRAGYAINGSSSKLGKDEFISRPIELSNQVVTAGVGFRLGNTSIDVTYAGVTKSEISPTLNYFHEIGGDHLESQVVKGKRLTHNIVFGLNWRF